MFSGRRKRHFLLFLAVYLLVVSTIAYLLVTPRPVDEYFQFYALGNKGYEGGYFQSNQNSVLIGHVYNWTLIVNNRFTSPQLVGIVVKLGNPQTRLPNGTLGMPSNGTTLATFFQALNVNATWAKTFDWGISSISPSGAGYAATIEIDGAKESVSIGALSPGPSLKLVFELWSISDSQNQRLSFGWISNNVREGSWLQIHFGIAGS